ncbi:MAG: hypothetical protein MHMPM18_003971, partial [Marteilia pararefringens]
LRIVSGKIIDAIGYNANISELELNQIINIGSPISIHFVEFLLEIFYHDQLSYLIVASGVLIFNLIV